MAPSATHNGWDVVQSVSVRFASSLLFLGLFLHGAAPAQTPAPGTVLPTFDVASVRPSRDDAPQRSNVPLDAGNVYSTVSPEDARTAAGGYLIASHQALWRYISFAYKLSGTQELGLRFSIFPGVPKSGAPFWVTGSFDRQPEYFDISARAPADTTIDGLRLRMQALLAERFHLALHRIDAETPVYAMVLDRLGALGPALRLHSPSDHCDTSSGGQITPHTQDITAALNDLPPVCGIIAHVASATPGLHYGARGVPLALLASSIPTMTGLAAMPRPVVDHTGLPGLYDFALTWVHDPSGTDANVSDNAANFRDALRKQLGLRLIPAHTPLSFLIIDHVERPSEN